jgi:hypothetical protein
MTEREDENRKDEKSDPQEAERAASTENNEESLRRTPTQYPEYYVG